MPMTQKPYRCLLLAQLICGKEAHLEDLDCRAQSPCPLAHIVPAASCTHIREFLGLGMEELLDLYVSTEVQKASHVEP